MLSWLFCCCLCVTIAITNVAISMRCMCRIHFQPTTNTSTNLLKFNAFNVIGRRFDHKHNHFNWWIYAAVGRWTKPPQNLQFRLENERFELNVIICTEKVQSSEQDLAEQIKNSLIPTVTINWKRNPHTNFVCWIRKLFGWIKCDWCELCSSTSVQWRLTIFFPDSSLSFFPAASSFTGPHAHCCYWKYVQRMENIAVQPHCVCTFYWTLSTWHINIFRQPFSVCHPHSLTPILLFMQTFVYTLIVRLCIDKNTLNCNTCTMCIAHAIAAIAM